MKHNQIISIIGIAGLAALIAMLFLTSPAEIGPLGVLLFFTTVYIVSFSLFTYLFFLFLKLAVKKKYLSGIEYLYCAIFAFAPIMLLMARSFGVISPWTISLIAIFIFLAEFLVYKRL